MSLFDRVMVLGAGGMLGRQFVAELTRRHIAHTALTHADLDLSQVDRIVSVLMPARPTLILNAAAYTKVDDCESNADHAMRVNGEAVGRLTEVVRQGDATLVHISSDYVFPGNGTRPYREDDATGSMNTLSAYGRSKLMGDQLILQSGCRHVIARTSWVYGPGGPNFVDTIRKAAATRPELKVVNDQRGRPTYSRDLSAGIFSLLDRGATGVFNVTNSDECTWYEFAREIVRLAGLNTPVQPCTTAEFPRPARRPAYSVLCTEKFASATGGIMRSWQAAVADYMQSPRAN